MTRTQTTGVKSFKKLDIDYDPTATNAKQELPTISENDINESTLEMILDSRRNNKNEANQEENSILDRPFFLPEDELN